MPDRARDESGKFVASAPVADGSQSEAPLTALEPGEKPRQSGLAIGASGLDTKKNERRAELDAKQDAVLARLFPSEEFKDKTPAEREEVAAAEAKEQSEVAAKAAAAEAKKVQERSSTPDRKRAEEAAKLLGLKQSAIDKMEDGELFELAAHRNKVESEWKQKATRLNELETLHKASAAKEPQPGSEEPAGRGLNIAEAAEPLMKALALDQSDLPAVEKFAKSIMSAQDARIAALEAAIQNTSSTVMAETADLTRSQLGERFPDLLKDDVWERIEERMSALAATGFYAEAAPTVRGRMQKLMADACKLESLEEKKPGAVDRSALSKAKANGDVSISSAGNTARGKTRDQQVLDAAKRAIEKYG